MILQNAFKYLTAPIDTEAGSLVNLPNFLIRWSIFMSANAVLQAIADVVIEALVLSEIITVKLPLRVEFLLLTFLSAIIAYLTLRGLREGNLDVTKNTLTIGLFVESSLVIGDIYLLVTTPWAEFWPVFLIRAPFMMLTSANIALICNILLRRYRTKRRRPHYRF